MELKNNDVTAIDAVDQLIQINKITLAQLKSFMNAFTEIGKYISENEYISRFKIRNIIDVALDEFQELEKKFTITIKQ